MVKASLSVCVLLAAAPSCPDLYSVATHGFQTPKVDVAGATATPDGSMMKVTVDFTARNTNPYPIELSGIDYDVAINGAPVFSGTRTEVSVNENSTAIVTLPGSVSTSTPALRALRVGQTANYTLSGVLHVKTPAGFRADVEFSTEGVFVVPAAAP